MASACTAERSRPGSWADLSTFKVMARGKGPSSFWSCPWEWQGANMIDAQ